jgi:hypothetical protein
VAVTPHPPGSADCDFLDACRVSLSQQYHRVQHNFYPLKRNENKKKLNVKDLFQNVWIFSFDNENPKKIFQNNIQHLKISKYQQTQFLNKYK